MAKRLDKTLADYVVGGLMPALLMGLLCSLCYFLLELAYSGAYMGQLKWILFFFIVGTVLIARISMRGDISERAGLYGIGLAIAAGLAMIRFVDIPKSALGGFGWLIPFSLMSIIWWSAHKLTQDSTWDDEEEDDGGGLLDAKAVEPTPTEKNNSEHWFDTYQANRTAEQKKKRPGLMVVYFSLAALPLFGMGQAMIPATNLDARRYAFWMLTIYVGCGLGMLLTTSFLGLRRYLRGRRLQMPAAMTALWLGVGTAMILTLMVLSAVLLPRPEAEYKLSQMLGWATSKERDANDIHFFEGSGGKSNKQGNGPQNKQNQKGGQQQGKNGKTGQNQKGNASGQPDQQGQQGKLGASSKQGEGGKSQGGQNGKQGNTGKQGGNQQGQGDSGKVKGGQSDKNNQKGENQKREDGDNSGNEKNPDRRNPNGNNQPQDQKQENEQSRQELGNQNEEQQPQQPEEEQQQSSMSWDWLKWIVYALMALGALYALWKWGNQLLDGLKQIWNEILAWFRGLWPQGKSDGMTEIPNPEAEVPPKPFAWFSNPLNSPGNFRSMEDMIRYSFAALHSWAYEQRMARQRDETPTEFAQRLGESVKHAHQDIRKLADLYSVVTYARTNAPQSSETVLRNFWSRVSS